jgi:hypothetical protein
VPQYSPALRFATAIVTCAALAGCVGSTSSPPRAATSPRATTAETAVPTASATAPPPSIAEIRATLTRPRNTKPYSATMKTRTLVDGEPVTWMVGRMNFNSELSAHIKLRAIDPSGEDDPVKGEIMITLQATYMRSKQTAGKWQRLAGSQQREAQFVANFNGYVRLLLKRGQGAVKGQKWFNGVVATQISGRIKAAQIKDLDPNLYSRLRKVGVRAFVADLWVDHKGRVVRLEQRFALQGFKFRNIVTLTKFRGPQTFRAPV